MIYTYTIKNLDLGECVDVADTLVKFYFTRGSKGGFDEPQEPNEYEILSVVMNSAELIDVISEKGLEIIQTRLDAIY